MGHPFEERPPLASCFSSLLDALGGVGGTVGAWFSPPGGGSAGFTESLPLGDSARVGFIFDAGYSPNLALTIGSAIKSVIDSCFQPSRCDVTTGQAFQIQHVATY